MTWIIITRTLDSSHLECKPCMSKTIDVTYMPVQSRQ